MRRQEDWYAYLNIATDAPTGQVEQAVERLSRQATALAVTAPERSQRLRDTVRAIKRDLLSGPEARAQYDANRDAAATPSPPPPPMPGSSGPGGGGLSGGAPGGGERISARIARFLRTGWVCAECGKGALPSDKFCTRCGTAIIPTRHETATPTTRVTCANCAASVGVNDAFCSRCGARVSK
jgi:double zinc ribbon protein